MKISTYKQGRAATVANRGHSPLVYAVALMGLLALTACGKGERQYPNTSTDGAGRTNPAPDPNAKRDTIFGDDGLTLFGGGGDTNQNNSGIGVNSFLWRASLDTISFMPLVSADPFGGVIITDWYQDPKAQGERFKITVYILDKTLRADGVKVSAFRQTKDDQGGWTDAAVEPNTGTKIENAILVRARQLRISTLETDKQ